MLSTCGQVIVVWCGICVHEGVGIAARLLPCSGKLGEGINLAIWQIF